MVSSVKNRIGLILFPAGAMLAQQAVSVWDGVYTAEQADRGKVAYAKECASCHGATLDGSGAAPPLAGDGFKSNWTGQSAGDLFDKVQATMPADKPGTLSREQTADILAFLFTSNSFPPGQKDLPSDAAALAKIRFDAAKPK
jgi:mono/diheme cytochrome c family protein